MSTNDLLLRPIAARPSGHGGEPVDLTSVAYVSPKILAVPVDAPNGGIADLGDDMRVAPAEPAPVTPGQGGRPEEDQ
jgi:hypothetical protein